eukprot:TRINITY_DN1844_c4_g1_i1.p1 TRINITY_DN1844_c4_g1~~TRINITY_DN1844_c4_g1_i1.p1  ORF type:complete len:454 (+),score=130.65 TRINITY_DN1844_c4_g1_i1:43-1404(+)
MSSSASSSSCLTTCNCEESKCESKCESKKDVSKLHFSTIAIHCGQECDPSTGAVVLPISMSTTFAQTSPGVTKGYDYSRTCNPNRNVFEECVASLEKAKFGLAFASGLAALTTLGHVLQSGDHIICSDDVYGGTRRFFTKVAVPSLNVTVSYVDLTKENILTKSLTSKTRMVWIETPTNPLLKLYDIAALSKEAHSFSKNVLVCVDNTFASPYLQNPLSLGCDIVLHSVTKYIAGHSDVVMGMLLLNDSEIHEKLRFLQNAMGAVPSPFDCWLALRGVKTLALRMECCCSNAMKIAKFLETHAKVEKVNYPGLSSHPQHKLACKQMRNFGGMITFFLRGGLVESKKFLETVSLFTLAESLGAVESLIEHPAIMTHASVPAKDRAALGISDSLIRMSVGIENVDDLIADLSKALDAIPSSSSSSSSSTTATTTTDSVSVSSSSSSSSSSTNYKA